MGANYETLLIPTVERGRAVSVVSNALHILGYRAVGTEEPKTPEEGFFGRSAGTVFVGPSDYSKWIQLCGFHTTAPWIPAYLVASPFGVALSGCLSPVMQMFSHDSGYVAGYSVFEDGRQVEGVSVTCFPDEPLGDFIAPVPPNEQPTRLAQLLGDPQFDYELFVRSYSNLEIATAGLAARLGLPVHLVEPFDIEDGEGGTLVERGEYKSVELHGWIGIHYEKAQPDAPADADRPRR